MESFTQELRKQIACEFCEYVACAACHQRYLLSTPEDAHCMNCRTGWTRNMLVKYFTNVFVNKRYKEHRENILFERERSLMPETQPYVEFELKCRKLLGEKVELEKMRDVLYREIQTIGNSDVSGFVVEGENWLEARIERHRRSQEVMKKISVVNIDIGMVDFKVQQYRNPSNTYKTTREVRFVRACPADGCKGFLSTAWKCGLCEVHVCSHCHDIKDSENLHGHVCDRDKLATAELLRKDTKPCPKCASMIFKISGCDQMYCTQCHTAFSWRTGQVVTGTIHNPHYYDYLRRTQGVVPRAPGDLVCGGLPEVYQFLNTSKVTSQREVQKIIIDIHRNIGHVQYLARNRYTPAEYIDNRDLRVKFMLNDFTEEEFKRKVQQREKADNRKRAIRDILLTYTTVATDIFQKYMRYLDTPRNEFFVEFETLRSYIAPLIREVAIVWKCAVPQFGRTPESTHVLGADIY